MKTVRVQIQADKKFCGWCHGRRTVCKQIIGDEGRRDWCDLFALELENEKGQPVRHPKCKEAECPE